MNSLPMLRVLVALSLRSLTSHKVKSLIVGGILAFGTFLLVVTTTFLNNIQDAMEKSVTGSLIGHIQVVNAKAKDELAFFGGGMGGQQDLGDLEDYPKIRDALLKVPNVKAVIPMGRDQAAAAGGNILDQKLTELREAVAAHDDKKVQALESRVRQLAEILRADFDTKRALSSNVADIEKGIAISERAQSDAFWAEFKADPLPALDWLDTKLAPLQEDGAQLFLAYLGTDLDLFAKKFDTFEIVQGQMVPAGQRGIILSKEFYEKQAKNLIARELDLIKAGRDKDHKTLAGDTVLREKAAKVARLSKRLIYEMGPDESAGAEQDIRAFLGAEAKGDLADIVKQLVTVDDANFDARYTAFYKFIAPRINLYSVRIGDTLTLRAFSKSGYARSANVKVYGTFHFRGLDDSLLASAYNLMDLMTFRDLYGLMTPEKKAELEAIKKNVGVKDVSADDAEAALFGGSDSKSGLEETAVAGSLAGTEESIHREAKGDVKPFTQADIDNGVVLHAAVLLENGALLRKTMADITKVSEAQGLGLKPVDWQSAAGFIGKLVLGLLIVLVVTFIVIFITALAIINNSMLMAMMDRIQEIGTMRAIGAQRNFILVMFFLETLVLSAFSMGLGVLGAFGLTKFLASKGLPAAGSNDIFVVLFGGPHMYPHMTVPAVIVGTICITLVSLVATLYPAIIATRVQPIVAMQRRE